MHYSLIFREASYMGLYSSAYAEQRLESEKTPPGLLVDPEARKTIFGQDGLLSDYVIGK